MPEIFTFGFMQRAFLVGACISVIAPCIGLVIVLKRLSAIGDATSHSALAGIAFGLMLGINPVIGAILFSLLAVLGIEGFRRAFGKYAEISTTVVLSAGVGLTAIFSGFVQGSTNLNSFLFGSIVAISDFELFFSIGLSVVVLLASLFLYRELFFISFDETTAKIRGVPVGAVNLVFMLLTAITVSVASRTVGALMISSLMVIPVACAMQVAKSYRQTLIFSVLFALIFTFLGLFLAYYLNLKPGGTIVLCGVIVLIPLLIRGRNR
ncbi:MAG: metal ABC transporter permease [Ruminococcaceae bacterium]|nr:metal ABC transporter permease [Oscillospiraceae bacterium]